MRTLASPLKASLYFCLVVFAFSLFLWLLEDLVGDRAPDIPIQLPLSSLMAFFPLVTACIFAYRKEKGKGIKELFQRVIDIRAIRRKVWYVPALLLMPAVLSASYLVMLLMNVPLPEPDLQWAMIPVFFAVFVIGAVWAVWHIVPWIQAGHDAVWIAWHGLVTVLLRIVIVWIYNNTGRSVLMAVLFHAGANVGFFLFPNYGSHYDPMVTGIILAVMVGIIVFLWGGRTLAAYRYVSR